jgi:hypothetical protein
VAHALCFSSVFMVWLCPVHKPNCAIVVCSIFIGMFRRNDARPSTRRKPTPSSSCAPTLTPCGAPRQRQAPERFPKLVCSGGGATPRICSVGMTECEACQRGQGSGRHEGSSCNCEQWDRHSTLAHKIAPPPSPPLKCHTPRSHIHTLPEACHHKTLPSVVNQ